MPSTPCSPATVDARAVRLSQAVVAVLVVTAAATRTWPLLALPFAHLLAGAALGPRGNLVGLAFRRVVRPRLATDAPEDARPPRFAAAVGSAALGAALLAHAAGAGAFGWALALLVAALATLSAATGFCVGCRLYWLVTLARRARPGAPGAGA